MSSQIPSFYKENAPPTCPVREQAPLHWLLKKKVESCGKLPSGGVICSSCNSVLEYKEELERQLERDKARLLHVLSERERIRAKSSSERAIINAKFLALVQEYEEQTGYSARDLVNRAMRYD